MTSANRRLREIIHKHHKKKTPTSLLRKMFDVKRSKIEIKFLNSAHCLRRVCIGRKAT